LLIFVAKAQVSGGHQDDTPLSELRCPPRSSNRLANITPPYVPARAAKA
jgi:hypothetical protein